MFKKVVVEGLEIKNQVNVASNCNAKLSLCGSSTIPLSTDVLSKHILITGGIGCGKTNSMFQMVDQIIKNLSSNEVMIIFDSKGDFLKEFKDKCKAPFYVISNDSNCNSHWNLMNEATIDGGDCVEDNLMEISTSLFKDMIDRDTSNPFFPLAARNIFFAILMYLYKTNELSGNGKSIVSNKTIYSATKNNSNTMMKMLMNPKCRSSTEQMIEYLGEAKKSYSPDGNSQEYTFTQSEQGASVLATLRNATINIFKGNFAKSGDFSIRNFVRQRGGKVLFIEYDVNQGHLLAPIYKTLIDLAIKETVGRKSNGSTYFIMDEFRLLPKLDYIDAGINMGRSLGAKFIVAMQNVQQIESIYGESETNSVLSGFDTMMNFRTTDEKTRKVIKERFGKCRFSYDVQSLSGGKQYEIGDVISDYDILSLDIGECILNIPSIDKNPIKFRFKEYKG